MRVGDLVDYRTLDIVVRIDDSHGLGLVMHLDTQGSTDDAFHLADVHWLDGMEPTWCRIRHLRVISEVDV
jgi:hypothetical protein